MKTLLMSVVAALAVVAFVGSPARAEVCPASPNGSGAVVGQPPVSCLQQADDPQPVLTDDGILTDTPPLVLIGDGCGGAADPNGPARVVNICDRAKIYLTDDDDRGVRFYTYPDPYAYPYAYPYSYPYSYPYPYYYGFGWGYHRWGHFDRDDFRGHGFHGGERGFHGGGGMGGHGGGGHRL